MQTTKGFTLLEMLLVLAVISVLSLAGLSAYQQRTQSFKVEKTALQMQEILEAAQAFYLDHPTATPPINRWPQVETDFAAYLSGAVLHNCPWTYITNTCYTITPSASNFSVSVTLPDTQANASQIAQMIANRLPNASVSDKTITASVSRLPVGVATPPVTGVQIIGISSVQNGQQLTLHPEKCDAGSNHNVYFMMSNFTACGYEGNPHCVDTFNHSITAQPLNVFAFGTIPQVTDQSNPPFALTSSITNPSSNVITVTMGGQWGLGNPGVPFESFSGYHASGVAIETCEPTTMNAQKTSPKSATPLQFY